MADGASAATYSCCERHFTHETVWAVSGLLVEQFIARFESAPDELFLDFDATDDCINGT